MTGDRYVDMLAISSTGIVATADLQHIPHHPALTTRVLILIPIFP